MAGLARGPPAAGALLRGAELCAGRPLRARFRGRRLRRLGTRLAPRGANAQPTTVAVLAVSRRGGPPDARARIAAPAPARRPQLGQQALPAHGAPRPARAPTTCGRCAASLPRRRAMSRAPPTRSRSARRSKLARLPRRSHRASRTRRLPRDGALRAAARPRSAPGSPRRSASAPGATLAVQLPSRRRGALPGGRAPCAHSTTTAESPTCGRRRLLAADPATGAAIAVRLSPGATARAVGARLRAIGSRRRRRSAGRPRATALPQRAGGTAARCRARSTHSSASTRWRRRSRSPRASGAPRSRCCAPPARRRARSARAGRRRAWRSRVPAALLALALERSVLAPLVGGLAAGYAASPRGRRAGQAALVAGGLLGLASSRQCGPRSAPSPSRPSPGCGRNDARRARC